MSKHKIADWARLLDLQDILAERDRMIAGLTVEYRDTQKQLAAIQEREAVIREQLEWYGDIRNYDDVDGALLCPVLVDCGLKARAALVADASQEANRTVTELARLREVLQQIRAAGRKLSTSASRSELAGSAIDMFVAADAALAREGGGE